MTNILELREKLRDFYGKYEKYVGMALKFIVTFLAFWLINSRMGYMEKLDTPLAALLLALVCMFLPINAGVLLAAVLILAHLWALSAEVCIVGAGLFLLMFFMYYTFAPGNGYTILLMPMMCFFKMPQAVPVSVGLLKPPASYLSMLCGIMTFYYIEGVQANVSNFAALKDNGDNSRITMALDLLLKNSEMFLMLGAVGAATLTVYAIRRRNINHAWVIAGVTGSIIQLVILISGSLLLGKENEILWVIAGSVLAAVVSLVLEFFLHNLDYSRMEQVQFEDDEYYYFVKAVPKIYMTEKNKKVKQITPRKSTFSRKELAEELDIDQELLD